MEDKKYYNDGARALGLEELDSVAGGRTGIRESEQRDYIIVREKMADKVDSLKSAGRNKAANALQAAFMDAEEEWVNDLKTSPENGPDLFISDYIEIW